MRVLMVCLGNICRSPLAEGILKHKVEQHGMDWEVDSAGTGNWHVGELPDHRSIATARQYDIAITYQRARQFRTADFEHFDRIFVMDTQNYRDVLRLAQNDAQREKVQLILDLTHPGENRSVPDPYWDDDGFEHVFQLLDAACGKLIQR